MNHASLTRLGKALPNKRAIITGTSSGLGLALAEWLLEQDWQVLGFDLNASACSHAGYHHVQMDITDQTAFAQALENQCNLWQGIDLLINNAGRGLGADLHQVPLAEWQSLMNLNFFAAVQSAQVCIPFMQQQGAGIIINIASSAGILPQIGGAAYATSKAALITLGESLNAEYNPKGIFTCTPMPYFFPSNILDASSMSETQRKAAHSLTQTGHHSARDIAGQILTMAAKQRASQLLPTQDIALRIMVGLKRLAPHWFLGIYAKLVQKALDQASGHTRSLSNKEHKP